MAVIAGADTNTSARMVVVNQSTTVNRKLATISPTAIVTATAIIKAATATAVRLSDVTTSRTAIPAIKPNKRTASGRISAITATVAIGVTMAAPSVNANKPT